MQSKLVTNGGEAWSPHQAWAEQTPEALMGQLCGLEATQKIIRPLQARLERQAQARLERQALCPTGDEWAFL